MPEKWAVLVVHGVGDTGPGVTVDTFLSSLNSERPRLEPDGLVEVHLLPDLQPLQEKPAANITKAQLATFPAHVRRSRILPRDGQPDGGPEQAVFAEVYWADLSTVREGAVYLILGLLSTVFSLRYLTDQAAVMPPLREPSKWSERRAHGLARCLRWILHLVALLLCGPIAALSALLTCIVLVDIQIYPRLSAIFLSRETPELIVSVAAGVAGLIVASVLWRTLSSTWRRFWICFGLGGLSGSAVMIWSLSGGRSGAIGRPINAFVESWSPGDLPTIVGYSSGLFFTIELFWLAIIGLMILALLIWAWAFLLAPANWKAGLGAAYGAAVVQIGLWLLIIPPLIVFGVGTLVPRGMTSAEAIPFLNHILVRFGLQLLLAQFLALVAGYVVVRRVLWARAWLARNPSMPPHAYPTQAPHIKRLLVNASIIGAIIVIATLVSVLTLFLIFQVSPPRWTALLSPWANLVSTLAIGFLLFIAAFFSEAIRAGLHVLTDVINHFYRRREPWPNLWGKPKTAAVQDFETQQRIEHRFKKVLDALLDEPDVTQLTIVSHSQGTMIAVDVLSLVGLDPEFQSRMSERLGRLKTFQFVTMGSPLTHLYEHYFPYRYPPLTDRSWVGLKQTVKHWINVYRVDDYVGTFINPVPEWLDPATHAEVLTNVPIDPGGHVGYWRQPAVFNLSPIKETLPGG